MGIEVLEIVDRAVELGMLPPAPTERACGMCDFLSRVRPRSGTAAAIANRQNEIADLLELRGRP